MRHLGKILATALSVALLTFGPATAALAYTGHFDWTASFNHTLQSRNWTQVNSGTVRIQIDPVSNCPYYATNIYVTLYRMAFPSDTNLGKKTVPCSTGATKYWYDTTADTYYFVLNAQAPGVTPNRITSGTTSYP